MKDFWKGTLLAAWAMCVVGALVAFGGVVADYALPFYLAGAALAIIWALKLFSVSEQSWPWTALHLPVLGLVAYTTLRYWTAPLRHEAHWELLRIGLYALVYFAAAFNFHRARHRAVALTVLILAAVLESLYGYWQHATGTDRVFWFPRDVQYHGRASGTYVCPNHLAGWLEVVALVLLAHLFVNPRPLRSLEHSVIIKLLELTALGAALVGLVTTGSRGGWFALAVGVTVFWFWAWQTRLIPPRVADALMGLLVLGLAGALAIPTLRHRVQELLSLNLDYSFDYAVVRVHDTGLEGRAAMSIASWRMFCEHPWWGVGPGAWRWFESEYRDGPLSFRPRYAHNDLLQFAAEYGAVGLVSLGAALVCFFWRALVLTRRDYSNDQRAMALGSLLAVVAMLAHSLGDFNMHIPANALLMATLVGLTAGLDAPEHCRRRFSLKGRLALGMCLLCCGAWIAWNAYRLCFAQRHVSAGRAAQAARQWTQAISKYQQAAALAPHWAEPHARIGEAWRLQRTPAAATNALSAYQRALELNPRDAVVWLSLALSYEQFQQTNQALQAFRQVFALDPLNADYWFEFGQFQERIGNTTAALRAYQQAVHLHHPDAGYHVRRLQK